MNLGFSSSTSSGIEPLKISDTGFFQKQNVCHSSSTVDTELLGLVDALHHVQDLYARIQLCQRVSTNVFTGDLQFSQRRCTSTATSFYRPRRPGRATHQH